MSSYLMIHEVTPYLLALLHGKTNFATENFTIILLYPPLPPLLLSSRSSRSSLLYPLFLCHSFSWQYWQTESSETPLHLSLPPHFLSLSCSSSTVLVSSQAGLLPISKLPPCQPPTQTAVLSVHWLRTKVNPRWHKMKRETERREGGEEPLTMRWHDKKGRKVLKC